MSDATYILNTMPKTPRDCVIEAMDRLKLELEREYKDLARLAKDSAETQEGIHKMEARLGEYEAWLRREDGSHLSI